MTPLLERAVELLEETLVALERRDSAALDGDEHLVERAELVAAAKRSVGAARDNVRLAMRAMEMQAENARTRLGTPE